MSYSFEDLLKSTWVQIFGAIGWILGVAAAIVQFRTYVNQRKTERGYQQLLADASTHWKGEYTQDQLAALQKELSELQSKLNTDLPAKARQAFLKYQLVALSDNIAEIYSRYQLISSKLKDDEVSSSRLPSQIQQVIESAILPTYIARRQRQDRIYWLLVLAVLLILLFNTPFLAYLLKEFRLNSLFDGLYIWRKHIALAVSIVPLMLIIRMFFGTFLREWTHRHFKIAIFLCLFALICFGIFTLRLHNLQIYALMAPAFIAAIGILMAVYLCQLSLQRRHVAPVKTLLLDTLKSFLLFVKGMATPRRVFAYTVFLFACAVIWNLGQIFWNMREAYEQKIVVENAIHNAKDLIASIDKADPSEVLNALVVLASDRQYLKQNLPKRDLAAVFEAGRMKRAPTEWSRALLTAADVLLEVYDANLDIKTLGAMLWVLDSQASRLQDHQAQQLHEAAVNILWRQKGRLDRTQFNWVRVPPEKYTLHTEDEHSGNHISKSIELSGFQILSAEVTVEQYARFDPKHLAVVSDKRTHVNNLPVVNVTWYEAYAFAAWVGGRLPTEVEWEHACRANSAMRFSYGNTEGDLSTEGWHSGNSGKKVHPVRMLKPNAWGIYDMHGNACEWVADWFTQHPIAADYDKWGPSSGVARVLRGGSYLSPADNSASAYRCGSRPEWASRDGGFRVVIPE